MESVLEKSLYTLTLISLVFWVYPETSLAMNVQTKENSALVFDVNSKQIPTQITLSYVLQPYIVEVPNDIRPNDILALKLKKYLEEKKSPLAEYSDKIITLPQWQRALAISWVESNYGIHCHSNNCSGIGGAPGMASWRQYPDKLAWFEDMTKLMERPLYKNRLTSFRKMNGTYNAGSENWVNGAEQSFEKISSIVTEAHEQHQALKSDSFLVNSSAISAELAWQ